MKHSILLSLLLWVAATYQTVAQQVDVTEARERALMFIQKDTEAGHRSPLHRAGNRDNADLLQLAYTAVKEGKICFYVFNVGQEQGFVIVGGDEAARTILGSCDKGSFDYDALPCGMKAMLDYYTEDISAAIKTIEANGGRKSSERGFDAEYSTTRQSQEELIKTKWDQATPYNRVCKKHGLHYTGCVMTAMAQIMNYFRYFDNGEGCVVRYHDPIDFSQIHIDWEHMRDTYNEGEYTDEEADAVANLMYWLDVAFDGRDVLVGTGSDEYRAYHGLVYNLRYSNSMQRLERANFSDDAWEEMLYHQIVEKKQPVYYESGSHAYLLDGYNAQDNTFHVNWGWGGDEDGYFSLTSQTENSNSNYFLSQNDQVAIIDFYPAQLQPNSNLEIINNGVLNGGSVTNIDISKESGNLEFVFDAKNSTEQVQSVRFGLHFDGIYQMNSHFVDVVLRPSERTTIKIPIDLKLFNSRHRDTTMRLLCMSPNDNLSNAYYFESISTNIHSEGENNVAYLNDGDNVCYVGEGVFSSHVAYVRTDRNEEFDCVFFDELSFTNDHLYLVYGRTASQHTIYYMDDGEEKTIHFRYEPKLRLKLNSQGFTTLCHIFQEITLPSSLQLYTCKGIDSDGVLILEPSDKAYPGEAYIVYGEPGDYYIPINTDDYMFTDNEPGLLQGVVHHFQAPYWDYDSFHYMTVIDDETVFLRHTNINEMKGLNMKAFLFPVDGIELPDVVRLPLPQYPTKKSTIEKIGDANGDGRVDILDIVYITHFLQKKTDYLAPFADADKNMIINADDMKAIETIVLRRQ